MLNSFFAGVGPELASFFSKDSTNWNHAESIYTFRFYPVTEHFVLKLSYTHNTDILGIDRFLLRLSAFIFAPSIAYFINLSLNKRYLCEDLKLARVTQIYKSKGSPDET